MKRCRRFLGVLLTAAVLACGGREPASTEAAITREQFVETYVALRRIAGDTAVVDSLRTVVLAEHGVTEEELRNFVVDRGEHPEELASVWEEIFRRLEEPEPDIGAADTVSTGATDTLGMDSLRDTLSVLDADDVGEEPHVLRRRERAAAEIQ